MNPKRIIQIAREFFYFKSIIKKYGESLEKGRYKLFDNMRSFSLDSPETIETASKYFINDKAPSKVTSLISLINKTNFYTNKKNSDNIKFEAIYTANNYDKKREIKLFSFKRKQILTICTSSETFEKQFDEYERLNNNFGMPLVDKYYLYDNSFVISMVDILPRPSDKSALSNIYHCISSYNINHLEEGGAKKLGDILDFSQYSEEMRALLQSLADRISPNCSLDLVPTSLQHGDLSRSNQLYGTCDNKTDFWWIDWEWAGNRIFFYDYFFYILNTALYYNEPEVLYSYLNGEFDTDLTAFFNTYDLMYEPADKMDYFLIFVIDFLKERVCDRGNLAALETYCNFLEKTIFSKE